MSEQNRHAPEIELKFSLDRGDVAALRRHPLLAGAAPVTRRLRSVYFDTPRRRLAKQGLSLRVRSSADGVVQTVKARRGAGLLERDEWETRVRGDQPDLGAARETPVGRLLRRGGRLTQVSQADVERTAWQVVTPSAAIEVVVDEGTVSAGVETSEICEVEFELKRGEIDALFAAARELGDCVPLRLGVESKAERGSTLASTRQRAVSSEPLWLDAGMSAGEALTAIVLACIRHYRRNEEMLLETGDDEALHQCRVALRRLRTAFSFLPRLCADPEAAALRARLKALAHAFGPLRDLDVRLASGAVAAEAARTERTRLLEELEAVLAGKEARGLVVDILHWLVCGAMQGREQARERLVDAAARRLEAWRRKIRKASRRIADISDSDRHRVRIAAKKLRYASEFLAGLPRGRRLKRHAAFVEACEDLQETLGAMNDAHVAALAMGAEEPTAPDDALMAAAEKAGRRFRRARWFWKKPA